MISCSSKLIDRVIFIPKITADIQVSWLALMFCIVAANVSNCKFFVGSPRSSVVTMCSLRDIGIIVDRYGNDFRCGSQDKILHVECGDGTITSEYLLNSFGKVKMIIGIDTSDEFIHSARDNHSRDSVHFRILDITQDDKVLVFRNSWELFDKVVCFNFANWIRSPSKALKNMRSLMKPDAECLFAFVATSPVFESYEKLAGISRWGEFMQDYRNFIPFTHKSEQSETDFRNLLKAAGFEVLKLEVMEPFTCRPTD